MLVLDDTVSSLISNPLTMFTDSFVLSKFLFQSHKAQVFWNFPCFIISSKKQNKWKEIMND